MSLKQAMNKAAHVVKTTRSLDFMNNMAKADASNHVEGINLALTEHDREPQVINSTMAPFHPFIQVSEAVKVVNVLNKKLVTPALFEAQKTNGEILTSDDHTFLSHRDTLEFFQSFRAYTASSQLLPVTQPSTGPAVLHVIDQIETIVEGITFGSHDKLRTLMEAQIFDSKGNLVINADKLIYVMSRYLDTDTVSLFSHFLQEYVHEIDNSHAAQAMTISFLQQSSKLSEIKPYLISQYTEGVYNSLISDYPELEDDTFLQLLTLDCYILAKDIENAYETLFKLAVSGYAPPAATFERYLEVVVKKLYLQSRQGRLDALESLKDLDDIIYSTITPQTAAYLLQISEHIDEISSVLDLVDQRIPSAELKQAYEYLEPTISQQIFRSQPQSKFKHTVTRLSVIGRVKKHIEISDETKKLLLIDAVTNGSLILARQLVTELHFNATELSRLSKLVYKRAHLEDYTFPGRDKMSKLDFLEALNHKVAV